MSPRDHVAIQQLQHELQCRQLIHTGHVETREFTRSPQDPPPPMSSLSWTIAAQQQRHSVRCRSQRGQSRFPSNVVMEEQTSSIVGSSASAKTSPLKRAPAHALTIFFCRFFFVNW